MKRLALPILLLVASSVRAQEPPKAAAKPRPMPTLQYDSDEIQIPVPRADDPKVREFGPESVRAAAMYLDDGALAWLRERACVACHTPAFNYPQLPLVRTGAPR